jgi:hypothetical protein
MEYINSSAFPTTSKQLTKRYFHIFQSNNPHFNHTGVPKAPLFWMVTAACCGAVHESFLRVQSIKEDMTARHAWYEIDNTPGQQRGKGRVKNGSEKGSRSFTPASPLCYELFQRLVEKLKE